MLPIVFLRYAQRRLSVWILGIRVGPPVGQQQGNGPFVAKEASVHEARHPIAVGGVDVDIPVRQEVAQEWEVAAPARVAEVAL